MRRVQLSSICNTFIVNIDSINAITFTLPFLICLPPPIPCLLLPLPLQLLSASLRNRVYDGIATILASSYTAGNGDEVGDTHTEKCLFWILALFRGGSVTSSVTSSGSGSNSSGSGSGSSSSREGGSGGGSSSGGGGQSSVTSQQQQQKSLFLHLPGHTKRDLKEALQQVSQSRSKKGLLAALLLHYFKANR